MGFLPRLGSDGSLSGLPPAPCSSAFPPHWSPHSGHSNCSRHKAVSPWLRLIQWGDPSGLTDQPLGWLERRVMYLVIFLMAASLAAASFGTSSTPAGHSRPPDDLSTYWLIQPFGRWPRWQRHTLRPLFTEEPSESRRPQAGISAAYSPHPHAGCGGKLVVGRHFPAATASGEPSPMLCKRLPKRPFS